MTSIASLAGMLLVGGILLVVSGIRKRPVPPGRGPDAGGRSWSLPSPERTALIGGVALGVLVLTRWPVAGIGAGLATHLIASGRESRASTASLGAKAQALATWAEMLRDATATPRGIEGVLVATANNAPQEIRPHVQALAERLPYEPLDAALDGLGEDLDHPVGDLVVTALRLSARTGGRQIRGVLDDLVVVAREEARMHRRVDVARARPRSEMRIVLAIMGAVVLGFVLLGRGYLEPYGTPLGQMVLILVGSCWGAGAWAMSRLGRTFPVERFLTREVRV